MGKILAQEAGLSGMPWRVLLGVGVSVLVLHLVALQVASSAILASQRLLAKNFVVRNMVIGVVVSPPATLPAPPAPGPAAPPKAIAPPRLTPPATPPAPQPLATPSRVPEAIGEPATAIVASPEVSRATVPEVPTPIPAAANSAAQTQVNPPEPVNEAGPTGRKQAAKTEPEIEFIAPRSVRLKYDVMGNGKGLSYTAQAELLWLHDGKSYEARLEVSAFLLGARVRNSAGSLTPEGLEPNRFSDRFRTEVAAHFVRNRQIVTFSANTPDTDLVPGMQDQLSVFVQIGGMLTAAPLKYPPGTELTFDTIGPRAAETWVLRVEAEETLRLPGGNVKTIKLVRAPRLQYEQTAELWLAPDEGYLPVRIKITEQNGDFVDQQWRSTETP